ncbi:longitudinals lacking protein, isoforms J/P/Q/S/Z isoform X1 [Eurosta solidaginis]|uniref:longitudinals lacking protein, isoforms J/P/Q/S/Z isoform X1 n=1 Tax=Eurosta solidaginis TaxID=178769 RepID=UPI0035307833
MEDDQQFCLRWNNHQSTLISVFDTLLENQTLVDCTLAAEGKFLKAHKVVLSACSPFFATLLQQQYDKHPIFILKDVKYQELRAMMDYMYRGEVNISQDQLAALLKAAESLQIKGLSDNRSGNTQKTEQHRGLNVPGSGNGGKLSGYTLEQTQTKRPRVGPSSMETTDLSGSREGSSSPSRRRRKIRRRSVENAMPVDIHDNSNSSQINPSSHLPQQPQQQQQQQQPQSTAGLPGIGAIATATTSLPAPVSSLPTGSSGVLAATGSIVSTQGTTLQMTPSMTKKTESVKGVSDAINTENIKAAAGAIVAVDEQNLEHSKGEKSNHKQKSSSTTGIAAKETPEMVIEPKSEYDEEGNEETVEDLTLDDEEMGMEDLDQNAGTSQAGEGSSQGYAPWQHDRSQDELLLAPQEAQQRDPQDVAPKATLKCAKASTYQPNTSSIATPTVYRSESQTQSQSESRIRVRDWLMLADQSVLRKTIDPNSDKSLTTTTNNTATNTERNAGIQCDDVNTNTPLLASTAILSLCSAGNVITSNISTTTSTITSAPKQPTLMRIGSIGRTTITCVAAPAVIGGDNRDINLINNGNMGVISAADLAAAGVELESVDESMTEVLVKIENLSSSTQDEDEDMEEEGDNDDDIDSNGRGNSNGKKRNQQRCNEKELDFNYDLKLSSPMSWAFDTIKIENEEEFEDILSGENDTTNTEDEDDLLTTAAATTKQAAVSSPAQIPASLSNATLIPVTECTDTPAKPNAATATTIQSSGCNLVYKIQNPLPSTIRRLQLSENQESTSQQLLLEQQQHLQHLQLQPTQQILHFKLASIPATITSVTTTTTTAPPLLPPPLSSASLNVDNNNCTINQNCADNSKVTVGDVNITTDQKVPLKSSTESTAKNSDFTSSVSDDKRYRILVQNQRMRKESLEHSEDMIYNADIEKPWVCRNCNRNYKWKNSLKCHLKNECGQPPRYFCSKLCGYATNVHSNLKRHLNTKCRDRIEEDQKNETTTSTYTLVFQKNE